MSSIYTKEESVNSDSKDFIDIDDLHHINKEEDSIEDMEAKKENSISINEIDIEEINLTHLDEENLKKVLNDVNVSKEKISLEKKFRANLKEVEENEVNDDVCYEYESRIEEEIYREYKTREKDKFKAFLNEISQYPLDVKNFNEIINLSLADVSRQGGEFILAPGIGEDIKVEKDLDIIEDVYNFKITGKIKEKKIDMENFEQINETVDKFRNETKSECNDEGEKMFLNGHVLKKIARHKGEKIFNKNKFKNTQNFFPYNLTDEDIFRKYSNVQNTKIFKEFLFGYIKNNKSINSKTIMNQISDQTFIKENNYKTKSYSNLTPVKDSLNKINTLNSRYLTGYLTTSNSNFYSNSNANSTPKNNFMSHSLTKFVTSGNFVNKDSPSNLNREKFNENNPSQNKIPISSPDPALEIYKQHIKEEKMKYLILKEENLKISKNFEAFKQNIQETEKKLKTEIHYLKNQISFLEDENKILINKHTESRMNLNKFISEISQKDSHIEDINLEISNLEKKLSNTLSENSYLKYQLENMKSELNYNINENSKKNEKISELQERNFNTEQEANEIRVRTSTEINNLRENKQNFDALKTNFFEVKNQYELLNMKYQTINDENFNLKRDLLLYEKEIRIKNETIQKLRQELIESNKKTLNDSLTGNGNNLNLNLNLNNYLKNGNENFEKIDTWNENCLEGKNIIMREENPVKNTRNDSYGNKNSKKFSENKNIILNKPENENRLKIVEDQYFALNAEREKIKGQLNKLPEFPKKRDQMEQKKELEDKIENLNKDLGKLKQEMKELSGKNRET